MTSPLVERYWVHSLELFDARMKELLQLYPDQIEAFELCRNNAGDPVAGFRMGRGKKNVFLLGREHGHEPVGPCGLVALMEGLATCKTPDTGQPFPQAKTILERAKLHMIPIMNPDGARRFAEQVPDSFPATFFKYCQEDSNRYRAIHSEPGDYVKHDRPPHFSEEEMARWRQTGRPIGSLFTEDGVELWIDWMHEKSPQVRAVKEQMRAARPDLFIDIHAWETGTSLLAGTSGDEAALRREMELGARLCDALERAGLPVRREISTLDGDDCSPVWVHKNFGCPAYLYEVHNGYLWFNPDDKDPASVKLPVVTKDQIILSVWHGITELLEAVAT